MVEPAGQIIADVGIIGIAACGELRQCQMLAYQQRDPADDVAVESHAFHDHGRMPSAFRRMVGHPRSFADVMQDAAEQQRLYDVHGKANILHDPYYNPNLTMDREDFSESDDLRGLKEGRITVQWRE